MVFLYSIVKYLYKRLEDKQELPQDSVARMNRTLSIKLKWKKKKAHTKTHTQKDRKCHWTSMARNIYRQHFWTMKYRLQSPTFTKGQWLHHTDSLYQSIMFIYETPSKYISRLFNSLSWLWLLFHRVKWKNIYFMSDFTSRDEIKVISMTKIWI